MDYSDETMKHATFYTDLFKNFFLQTKSISPLLHELISSLFTYVTTVKNSETYAPKEIINDTNGILSQYSMYSVLIILMIIIIRAMEKNIN